MLVNIPNEEDSGCSSRCISNSALNLNHKVVSYYLFIFLDNVTYLQVIHHEANLFCLMLSFT